jgi:uncharacterized Fe-S center protein
MGERSKVWYMDDRAAGAQDSLVIKMLEVFKGAGIPEKIKPGDNVAIKVHMGEWNNTSYLRPVYVRALADEIKRLGAVPFAVDTTTIPYTAFPTRTTAVEYLNTVHRNGYEPGVLGCPIVIADGFLGLDDVHVDLPEGMILKEQYVAMGIFMADYMVVLSHFKGHPLGIYGGALKNIGIGAVSRRGKYNCHMSRHPKYGIHQRPYYAHLCIGKECPQWMLCQTVCPENAFTLQADKKPHIQLDRDKCTGCLACAHQVMCGVVLPTEGFFEALAVAIADSALAVTKALGKEKMSFINLAIDMSPWCDCVPFSDRSVVPNLGVLASYDPVAIDRATLDLSILSFGVPGSKAEEMGVMFPGSDKFSAAGSFVGASQNIQCNVGEKIGLGTKAYEFVKLTPPEDFTPYMPDRRPAGLTLGRFYRKKHWLPKEGFNRAPEINFEEVR